MAVDDKGGPPELKVIKAIKERIRVGTDPEIDVFEVTLERQIDQGIWKYSAVSLGKLGAFLNGVRAAAALAGWRFEENELSHEPDRYFNVEHIVHEE